MVESRTQHFIGGRWVDSIGGKPHDVINPATEEVTTRITLGSSEDVDAAVDAARAAFESFSRTTPQERAALLERAADAANDHHLVHHSRFGSRKRNVQREPACRDIFPTDGKPVERYHVDCDCFPDCLDYTPPDRPFNSANSLVHRYRLGLLDHTV
jgi:hypothetical protein